MSTSRSESRRPLSRKARLLLKFLCTACAFLAIGVFYQAVSGELPRATRLPPKDVAVQKTDAEWRKELTPAQFKVLRRKATEKPYSGKYARSKKPGIYECAACGQNLFDSNAKFESGTGWPSFWLARSGSVRYAEDRSNRAEVRVEVMCNNCGSHLGHVFADGPAPTFRRYCMNSIALNHIPFGAEREEATNSTSEAKTQ